MRWEPMWRIVMLGENLESITPLLIPRSPSCSGAENGTKHEALASLKHYSWDASKQET